MLGHTNRGITSFHYGQDVRVLVQEQLLIIQLDFGSSVVGQQHGVSHVHGQLEVLALLVQETRAHLHDGAVVVVAALLEDDARGGLGLGLQLPNQDSVEGGQHSLERRGHY